MGKAFPFETDNIQASGDEHTTHASIQAASARIAVDCLRVALAIAQAVHIYVSSHNHSLIGRADTDSLPKLLARARARV